MSKIWTTLMTDDKKPDLKVVKLSLPGLQNPSAMLRKMADDMDAGIYGGWQQLAIVMNAENNPRGKVQLFGFGLQHPTEAVWLLNRGMIVFGSGEFD